MIPNRLSDLADRPAWRTSTGRYKPRGRKLLHKATVETLTREGLATRTVLAGHDALVITDAGKAVLEGKPQPKPAPPAVVNPPAAEPAPARMWWQE